MGNIIEAGNLKPIKVPVADLLINSFNNPCTGKSEDYLNAYIEEVKHFGYFDIPLVYKNEPIWTNTPQEYLVLTNVQEVETAKLMGRSELQVLLIENENFTPEDAFRFAIHRRHFFDLSYAARFELLDETYKHLNRNNAWSKSIITDDGKTISKVSKVVGVSVGSIHKCMTIGNKNKSLLLQVDEKKITLESAFQKVQKATPPKINLDPVTKRRKRNQRSYIEGYVEQYEKTNGNIAVPINELTIEANSDRTTTNFILNGIVLGGFKCLANNMGDNITEIKFTSETEPFVLTLTAPYMEDWFKEKGFSTEPVGRIKLDASQYLPTKRPEVKKESGNNLEDAGKAAIKLGCNKRKVEEAICKITSEGADTSNVSDLIKHLLSTCKQLTI